MSQRGQYTLNPPIWEDQDSALPKDAKTLGLQYQTTDPATPASGAELFVPNGNKRLKMKLADGTVINPSKNSILVRGMSEGNNLVLSGTQNIDGVSYSAGDLILVRDQSTAAQNGVYVVASGAWTRHPDFSRSDDFYKGGLVFVQTGNGFANTLWVLTSGYPSAFTIGVTAVSFVQVQPRFPGITFVNDGITASGAGTFSQVNTSRIRKSPTSLTPGATVPMEVNNWSDDFTFTPDQDCTINATGVDSGRHVLLVITTSGTTDRTITFGTGFRAGTPTLATGTVSGKVFVLEFYSTGASELVQKFRSDAQ